MPPTSSMPGALAKFVESNLAQLVDQLEPIIRQLLAHFIAASRPTTELDGHFDAAFFSDRELASRLLALLAKREREMPLLMAFLWALLRCSQLGLFCRLLGHHLVNVDNFEQFVKAKEPKPDLANLKVIAEDEEDKLADANVDQRIQFAERHSELLRLKLTDSGKVNQLLGEWKVMAVDREGLEQRRASRLLECNRLVQLLTMPTQHRRAYDAFCLTLLLTRQFRLFCIFHGLADLTWMEQCWASLQLEQEANEAGEREKLPQQVEEEPLGVLADLNVESVDSGGVSVNYEFYQAHKEQVYANFTQPRGIALIINNYAFRYRSHREGTHADVENLNNLLRQLSYRVMVHNDLTAEQIHREIHAFSQMPEHRGMDSAMVILLSHGEYGVILGSDEQFVELHLLRNYLNTQNAPGLAGKPKIMIVQACRGSNFDSGVTRAIQEECQHDGLLNLFYSRPKKGPMTVSAFNSPPPPSNSPSPRQSRAGQHFTLKMITEPTDADFLTAFATTPYYVSWRNSAAGTFFVQSLCEVFAKWAKEEDILTMLTRVNQKVAERQARQDNCVYKQVSLKESTLRKKFYFFPGVRQSPI